MTRILCDNEQCNNNRMRWCTADAITLTYVTALEQSNSPKDRKLICDGVYTFRMSDKKQIKE